jgi:hypothetical protein
LKYIYREVWRLPPGRGSVLAVPAPDGEGEMEEGMDNRTIQVILLVAAAALLILYLLRRRKRKGDDK